MHKFYLRKAWLITILSSFVYNLKAQDTSKNLAIAFYAGISISNSDYLSTSFANITKPKSIGQTYKYGINSNNHFDYLFLNLNFQFTIHQAQITSYYWNNQWIEKDNFNFDNDDADPYKNLFLSLGIGAKHSMNKTTVSLFPEAGLVFSAIGNQYNTFDPHRSSNKNKLRTDYEGWNSVGINWGGELNINHRFTPCLSLCISAEWLAFNTKEMHFPNPYTSNRIAYRSFNILIGLGYAVK